MTAWLLLAFLGGPLSFGSADWCLLQGRALILVGLPECVLGCACDPATALTIDGPPYARNATCRDTLSGEPHTVTEGKFVCR